MLWNLSLLQEVESSQCYILEFYRGLAVLKLLLLAESRESSISQTIHRVLARRRCLAVPSQTLTNKMRVYTKSTIDVWNVHRQTRLTQTNKHEICLGKSNHHIFFCRTLSFLIFRQKTDTICVFYLERFYPYYIGLKTAGRWQVVFYGVMMAALDDLFDDLTLQLG